MKIRWLRSLLALIAVLAGCQANNADTPSIWGRGPIRTSEDAQRLVAEAMDHSSLMAPQLPDPRDWRWEAEDWCLGLNEALAIAMTNSPIVRVVSANQPQSGTPSSTMARSRTTLDPAIESTRVEGMNDHLEMPVNHVFMMRDKDVFAQVIHYLEFGRFMRVKLDGCIRSANCFFRVWPLSSRSP